MPDLPITPSLPTPAAATASAPGTAPAAGQPGATNGADAAARQGQDAFANVLNQQIARTAAGDEVNVSGQPLADPLAALNAKESAVPGAKSEEDATTADPQLTSLLPALQALLAGANVARQTPEKDAPSATITSAQKPANVGTTPLLATTGLPSPTIELDAAAVAAGAPADGGKAGVRTADFAAQLSQAAESAVRAGPEKSETQPLADSTPGTTNTPALHAAASHAPANAPSATPTALRVETPVGANGWDQEVGQKLVLMSNRDGQRAELTLTPPHLGKVEVTITVSGDQTNAFFVSANPNVRDALEQALPRLREMLADAGVQLGQANVSADSGPRDGGGNDNSARSSGRGGSRATGAAATSAAFVRRGNTLIDTFA